MCFSRFFIEIASDCETVDQTSHNLSFISDANVVALHRLLWNHQEKIGDYLSCSRDHKAVGRRPFDKVCYYIQMLLLICINIVLLLLQIIGSSDSQYFFSVNILIFFLTFVSFFVWITFLKYLHQNTKSNCFKVADPA